MTGTKIKLYSIINAWNWMRAGRAQSKETWFWWEKSKQWSSTVEANGKRNLNFFVQDFK